MNVFTLVPDAILYSARFTRYPDGTCGYEVPPVPALPNYPNELQRLRHHWHACQHYRACQEVADDFYYTMGGLAHARDEEQLTFDLIEDVMRYS
jgi:hypothetical protein